MARRNIIGIWIVILAILQAGCQAGGTAIESIEEGFEDGYPRFQPITNPVFETISPDGLVLEPELEENQGIAMPGPLLLDEGQYFLFINVANEDQGPNAVYTATSEDGLIWHRGEEPILMDPPGTGTFYLASDVLQDPNGLWHLFLTTNRDGPEYGNEFSIWQATSPALEGPWTLGESSLLERGEPDTWDQAGVLLPLVVETDYGYLMYYHGVSSTEQFLESSLGLAVSVDGDDWVRGNPSGVESPYPEYENVVISRFDGDFGNVRVSEVWRTTEGWQMLYFLISSPQQFPEVRLAVSRDGIEWEPLYEPVSFTMSGTTFFPGVVDATLLPRVDGYDLIIGGFFASSTQEAFFMTQIRSEE